MIYPAKDGRWILSFLCGEGHRHRLLTEPLSRREALVRHAQASGGPCPKTVARQAKEAAERARREQAAERKLFETVAEYEEWARRHRPRSYVSRKSTLGQWKAALGDVPLKAIGVADVERVLRRARDAGWRASTHNRSRQSLFHLFRWAIERGYATENPVRVVERLSEANEAPFALTPDQEARLMAALIPSDRAVFLLATNTGLRFGELARQEWRHVDLVAGTLQVTHPKHVRPQVAPPVQVIPLNATAKALLARLERTGPRILPGLTASFLNRFAAACRQLGLPAGVSFHKASRDTFATRLAAQTPAAILMQLTRHTTYQVARRYLAPDLDAMRAAVNRLAAPDTPTQSRSAPLRGDLVADAEALLAQVAGKSESVVRPNINVLGRCQASRGPRRKP